MTASRQARAIQRYLCPSWTRRRFLLLLLPLFLSGCSLQKLAVRSTGGILDAGFTSLMQEGDLVLARSAIESDLKLLEGLILADPANKRMVLLAAQGFTSYALGFVEDEDTSRAVNLYLRARDYGSRWVKMTSGVDLSAIDDLDAFRDAVDKLPPRAVPGVFWMANAWASSLLLRLNDVNAIADLPKTEILMRFVLEHDESYYYAGAHLFFGAYYGGRPRMLGGNPVKAKQHLDKHIELTSSNFLMGRLFVVKFLDLPALDGKAARAHLQSILEFPIDSKPGERLPNRIAQMKARWLLDHLEDYL